MIRKRAIRQKCDNAMDRGHGACQRKRVSPPHPTCSRRCTRPLAAVYEAQAPNPSTRPSARKTWRHWSIFVDAPISARHCSPRAGTSTVSRCAGPTRRSKAGKPIPTGRTISSSSRSIGAAAGALSQGKVSTVWREYGDQEGKAVYLVRFSLQDCRPCHARPLCSGPRTRAPSSSPSQEHCESAFQARASLVCQ